MSQTRSALTSTVTHEWDDTLLSASKRVAHTCVAQRALRSSSVPAPCLDAYRQRRWTCDAAFFFSEGRMEADQEYLDTVAVVRCGVRAVDIVVVEGVTEERGGSCVRFPFSFCFSSYCAIQNRCMQSIFWCWHHTWHRFCVLRPPFLETPSWCLVRAVRQTGNGPRPMRSLRSF